MRLFVAVNLPAEERRAIWAATATLRAAKAPVTWVAEENFHITLRFLGPVADEHAGPIGTALVAAVRAARPFDLTLGGLGAFPDFDRAQVIWLGVERHPALELLAHDIERALRPFGFEPELRPFHPHLTIGRAKKSAGAVSLGGPAAQADATDYAGLLTVGSVDLMESSTARGRARYTVRQTAPLEGAA